MINMSEQSNIVELCRDLTPKQREAVKVWLLHDANRSIADAIGVTEDCVSRWLNHDANFRKAVAELEDAALGESIRGAIAYATRATQELIDQLLNGKTAKDRRESALAIHRLSADLQK